MKVILQVMNNLGSIGDVVTVKGGFARNFLLPRGKAILATPENMKEIEAKREELEKIAAIQLEEAHQRMEKLNLTTVVIRARSGEAGKLFGSIGVREIAKAISENIASVKKNEISLLGNTIRALGRYDIEVILHPDVRASVICEIIKDEIK